MLSHTEVSSVEASSQSCAVRLQNEMRAERAAFAAKVRVARAVLAMSQDEFAHHVGLTQKSVHRIEQAAVEPKFRTVMAIERFWAERGISFGDGRDGGFSLTVEAPALARD